VLDARRKGALMLGFATRSSSSVACGTRRHPLPQAGFDGGAQRLCDARRGSAFLAVRGRSGDGCGLDLPLAEPEQREPGMWDCGRPGSRVDTSLPPSETLLEGDITRPRDTAMSRVSRRTARVQRAHACSASASASSQAPCSCTISDRRTRHSPRKTMSGCASHQRSAQSSTLSRGANRKNHDRRSARCSRQRPEMIG
jgi:hypothetical protein